ncbi:MAG: citrate transporter [Cyanobacteria bacterium SZAS-4]|nr:citrate transporter [Cyanobacteria bacterium SZAS-4]
MDTSSFIGIACLSVFLCMAMLMYSRRISALLALPIMAILIAVIAGISGKDILTKVISEGAVKLNNTYTTTMFGAMLAELLNKQGIAKSLIRWVAEFAGDNPFWLAIVLTAVTTLLFSTLGGLGAVIMVGTIVLPVMLSLGISSVTAGSLFLFGISLGGMFNIASWSLYKEVLGLQQAEIIQFVLPFSMIFSSIVVAFLLIELRSRKNLKYGAICLMLIGAAFYALQQLPKDVSANAEKAIDQYSLIVAGLSLLLLGANAIARHKQNAQQNPSWALLTPILPLVLVLFFNWPFIPAFMFGITFCALITWKRNSINVLTRSIIDGITAVIPAVVLMMGIGMLINSVSHEAVTHAIRPLLQSAIPTQPLPYVIVFTIIAPLALYRGPLSLWGMGSGLVTIVKDLKTLTSPAIMSMLLSVGQLQGICDPTNTANIWIATYLNTDTQVLLKKTIPYAWAATICGLLLSVSLGYVK